MTDLSTRILAAIEETERRFTVSLAVLRSDLIGQAAVRIARWVQPPEAAREVAVQIADKVLPVDAADIVVDRAAILRGCEADKRTVQRHIPGFEILVTNGVQRHICNHCHCMLPCPDLLDRADAYGVPTTPTGETK